MQAVLTKQSVYRMVDSLPNALLPEVADYITFIKLRNEKSLFKDLETLSLSGADFWDNPIDDEVWNDA